MQQHKHLAIQSTIPLQNEMFGAYAPNTDLHEHYKKERGAGCVYINVNTLITYLTRLPAPTQVISIAMALHPLKNEQQQTTRSVWQTVLVHPISKHKICSFRCILLAFKLLTQDSYPGDCVPCTLTYRHTINISQFLRASSPLSLKTSNNIAFVQNPLNWNPVVVPAAEAVNMATAPKCCALPHGGRGGSYNAAIHCLLMPAAGFISCV